MCDPKSREVASPETCPISNARHESSPREVELPPSLPDPVSFALPSMHVAAPAGFSQGKIGTLPISPEGCRAEPEPVPGGHQNAAITV